MYHEFSFWWTLILVGVVLGALQGTCAYLTLLERKVSAYMQDRIGPNRVGPYGLLQPLVDGVKFVLKEDIIPSHVDKLFFLLAPCIAISTAYLAFAVVPFGPTSVPPTMPPRSPTATESERRTYDDVRQKFEVAYENSPKPNGFSLFSKRAIDHLPTAPETASDQEKTLYEQFGRYIAALNDYEATPQFVIVPRLDIGILFVFSISSLAVYGIILAGWSSNDKYSMIGALRSSAQLISYEIPMATSVLGVVLLCRSLNLERIIAYQTTGSALHGENVWLVFLQPLAFLLFLVSIFAECNRVPFDLPEAEQELVGGYLTEYSAMKFALFFLAEYTHMMTTSFLAVALFFGGWHFPWIATTEMTGPAAMIVKLLVVAVKMGLFIIFFMLIRWTIPRFRFDQLMNLAWRTLVPLAAVNLLCVLVVQHLVVALGAPPELRWLLLPLSLAAIVLTGVITLRRRSTPKQRVRVVRGHEKVEVCV
jgi:NADH-quinone oxidoreductase subunit H